MDRIIVGLLAFVMSNMFLDLASTSISNIPVDTEVLVGHSTYLNCSTSDPSKEIHWYHYPVGTGTKDHAYVYAHGRMHPPFDKRFRIDKGNSPGSFDLVVTEVEFDDAGLYVCQNGGGTGQLISAQLVVLDTYPFCETNIKSDGFIGPNSCDLETDKVRLSCGVSYHGNIPPALEWTRVGQKTLASSSEPLCQFSDTQITCNITIDTDIDMDGSTFACQTKRVVHGQYECTTDEAKVLYAVGEEKHLEKTIGDDVSCSAKTNSPSCRYSWIWFDGVTENIISNDQTLKVTEQGWHRCEANCKIKESPCNIVPMLVKGSAVPVPAQINDPTLGVIIAVVVTFAFCLMAAAIPGYFLWRKVTGDTQELKSSVEELRVKDSQWKEERMEIQEQLRQAKEITATLLEVQAKEQDQIDGQVLKRNLEKLDIMTAKLLRIISINPVFTEEPQRVKTVFHAGSMSAGIKKIETETPSMINGKQSNQRFIICDSFEGAKPRRETPSLIISREENSPLISDICKEFGKEIGKSVFVSKPCDFTLNTRDFMASKGNRFAKNGQYAKAAAA